MAPRLPASTALLVWLGCALAWCGCAAAARAPSRGTQPRQAQAQAQAAEGSEAAAAVTMPVPNLPDCTTPLSQAGNCVRLHNCKPLLDLLKTSRLGPRGLPDSEVTLLLRRSHCGFQGNSVMVCCPVDASAFRGKPSSTAAPALGNAYAPQQRPRPPGASGGAGSQQRPTASTGGDSSFEFNTPAPEAYPAPSSPADNNSEGAALAGAGFAGAGYGEAGGYPAPSSGSSSSSSYPAAPEAAPALSAQPEGQDSFPLENLGLLPVEICGLMLHPGASNPGNNRTGLMQYPWMARLGYKQGDGDAVEFLCAGSLISERYVVTAAHCVEARDGLATVRLGESDAATDPDCVESTCAPGVVDVAVEEKVVHEDYRRGVNDIALLRLARPVAFSEAVSPICLPVQSHNRPEEDLAGRHMTLAGWGNSSPYRRQHAPSRWLLQHRMHVESQSACRAAYDALDDVHFQPDKHLCVGGGCYGDSGSPLMLAEGGGGEMMDNRAVLYGVLSYGLPDCALRSSPLAFTKVSHHVPWLVRNLRPNPFVPKDRTSGSGVVDPRRTRHPAPGAGYLQH